MIGVDPPSDRELYDQLRDNGLSHEDAVKGVMARRSRHGSTPDAAGPAAVPAHERTDVGAGTIRSLLKGATFGFNDELSGAMNQAMHPLTPGAYATERDRIRAAEHAFHDEHPAIATTGEVAGGILPTIATLGGSAAVAGGSALARGAKTVATGAALSGLVGAGNAEGPIASQLRQIRDAAATGGALVGGGAVVGKLGGGLMRGVANVVGKPIGGASSQADRLLLQAIKRDDETPTSILAAYRARQGAKPETLADLAGENVRGLARGAQAVPGKAKNLLADTFEERAANQPARLAQDLESGMGLARQDTGQLVEDLIQQRAASAKPLYEQAYAHGAVDNPRINELLTLPWFKDAYRRARRLAAAEGVTLPQVYRAVAKPGKVLGADGQPTMKQVMELSGELPTVQTLDYLKRALDDVVNVGLRSTGKGGLGATEARAVRNLQREMLGILDQEVPAYGAARAQYAGDTGLREAVETGRDILKKDPRVVAREIADLSADEQQMYRVGALDAVRRKMDAAKDGRDLTRMIFGDEETRQRMQALFPDVNDFKAFAQQIEREATMAKTRNTVLAGSPTARIQSEIADMGGVDPSTVGQMMTGNVPGAITSQLTKLAQRRGQGLTSEVADQLGTRFAAGAKNPRDLEELLQVLESVDQRSTQRTTAVRRTTRTAASRAAPHATEDPRQASPGLSARERYDDLRDQGVPSDEATRRVRQEFGLTP